ncbi:putative nuclease HARBI1 [Melanotaenia boesemani]|uniref:putative nuclease HARBI1 n=1 Tax=Melanotaenia boesemani TaxID=1250792 RepID=UPI001C04048D|nr:putative nuclease HARBI1 [Melanotaenia boesemani]
MAAAILLRRRRRHQRRRRERIFSVRINILGMSEERIVETYRLSSIAIIELLDELRADLDSVTRRGQAIPCMTKLLAVLHFLASGSFQRTVANSAGISQSRLSSILSQVLKAMLRRMGRYIHFPCTPEELNHTKIGFHAMAGFLKVIGAIDCTHVQLVPPSDREHIYRNRKHTHSMNMQVVCDSKGTITNVVAKYPGSVHDSFILRNSVIFSKLRDGEYGDGWLLGDGAYPLQPFLLTPVLNPATAGENRYNAAHVRTRNIVERTFGILKSRFRCLDRTGGALLYSPEKVSQIVIVCCMLHNVAKRHGMEHGAMDEERQETDDNHGPQQPDVAGQQTRITLIRNVFS